MLSAVLGSLLALSAASTASEAPFAARWILLPESPGDATTPVAGGLTPDAGTPADPAPSAESSAGSDGTGAAEGAASAGTPASASAPAVSTPAPAAEAKPAPAPAPVVKEEPKKEEAPPQSIAGPRRRMDGIGSPAAANAPDFKAYVPTRIRYVWPFAKEHELLPGDVRIPLPIWLMAVGGGASIAAGVPFYTLARNAESRLVSGDPSLRTDADRAALLGHGKTMEAWGVGLWAAGGALIATSWTLFYLVGMQDKPKGLNAQLSVGPTGGSVSVAF